MKYFSLSYASEKVEEITADRAMYLLDGCYKSEWIEDAIHNEKAFKLQTPFREIWTVDDDGSTPDAIGVCE